MSADTTQTATPRASARRTDEFMSVVAHDLRNPLAVVKASAQMALRQVQRGDTESATRRITAIVEQAERLNDLLESFVDAARVGEGALALRLDSVDLGRLVRESAEHARPTAAEAPVQRQLLVEAEDGVVVQADARRLGRAVRSLAQNAFLYGDPSSPVVIRMLAEDECVRVLFVGGGPGPLPDEQEQLFQRFYRGHMAAEVGHSGSGLGLYLARGIARAHGGDARQVPGEEPDTFEIELPLSVRPA